MSGEPESVRRVVVGVDGSESSLLALRWGAWLAGASSCPILAVMAWEYPRAYGWAVGVDGWDPKADAQVVLGRALDQVFGADRPVGLSELVHQGGAAELLVDLSASAQTVVVGGRGRGGFKGLLLGSVSAAVAEHAACPVLVVHGERPPA